MSEYEVETSPGLPGKLPPGERILWQGAPEPRALARTALHARAVAVYFALLVAAGLLVASGSGLVGIAITAALGVAGVGLLHLLAWAMARATIYTLTDRRIVMRIGVAVPMCINLPLAQVAAAELRAHPDGTGDLSLAFNSSVKLGYAMLWPHARPWRLSTPQPMLRAVPDAAHVAALVARACLAANPAGRVSAVETPATARPALPEAAAA